MRKPLTGTAAAIRMSGPCTALSERQHGKRAGAGAEVEPGYALPAAGNDPLRKRSGTWRGARSRNNLRI